MKSNSSPQNTIQPSRSGRKEPIFTRNFTLTFFANIFTFGTFHILLATIPLYVVATGGSKTDVGIVAGVFSITSMAVRPFVGMAADAWGRKKIMVLGAIGIGAIQLLYIVSTSVPPLIAVRFVHGIAFAIVGTCTNTIIADIAPQSRRGEAVAFFGISNNIAMSAGPALGILIMSVLGFSALFMVSAAIGMAAFVFCLAIREPARSARPKSAKRPPLLAREALFPTFVFFFFALTYGAVTSFIALFETQKGIGNPGLFFTVQAIVVLSARSFTGQLSDRFGRGMVAVPGMFLAAGTMFLISRSSSLPVFLALAALYATAFSAVHPPMMALLIDRVKPEIRGVATGIFMSAMDAGIGVGAFLCGLAADRWGYSTMYALASFAPLVAAGLFLTLRLREGKAARQAHRAPASEAPAKE